MEKLGLIFLVLSIVLALVAAWRAQAPDSSRLGWCALASLGAWFLTGAPKF